MWLMATLALAGFGFGTAVVPVTFVTLGWSGPNAPAWPPRPQHEPELGAVFVWPCSAPCQRPSHRRAHRPSPLAEDPANFIRHHQRRRDRDRPQRRQGWWDHRGQGHRRRYAPSAAVCRRLCWPRGWPALRRGRGRDDPCRPGPRDENSVGPCRIVRPPSTAAAGHRVCRPIEVHCLLSREKRREWPGYFRRGRGHR